MIFVQILGATLCLHLWLFAHWSNVYFPFIFMHFFHLNWHKWSLNDKRVTPDQREEDWQQGLETTCIVQEQSSFTEFDEYQFTLKN